MMYKLGNKSRKELEGVDQRLVMVVEAAIEMSTVDFAVHDGGRTVEEQRKLVEQGYSKTMNSKHLEGRAVDLVPFIEGKLRWWWPQIYEVAAAMYLSARLCRVPIKWGCVWDRRLNDLCQGVTDPAMLPKALQAEGLAYNARHPGPDFPDGPHFELVLV